MNLNKENRLVFCHFCEKQYYSEDICPPCQKLRSGNGLHHGKKAPKGSCQQCLTKGIKLTKYWRDQYYCDDCIKWSEEIAEQGIGHFGKRFNETYCRNCGKCASCKRRKILAGTPTRDLMIEVMEREEFKSLLSWEDDSWKLRYGEIMLELKEVDGLLPEKIRGLVEDDVLRKEVSKRKFSRGT